MIEIFEDENSDVHIGGLEIFGFITDRLCDTCKSKLVYIDKYDAIFCPQCNEWTEIKCKDPECDNCKSRPERPL